MLKNFTACGLFLLASIPCLLMATTMVHDSNKSELINLKAATEKLFNKSCGTISENIDKSFSLDLKECLPPHISQQLSAEMSSLAGPNCHNFVLNTLGFTDSLYMTMPKELNDLYLSDDSPFCFEVKDRNMRRTGDWITLGGKNDPGHSFIYLTEKFALNKNGPSLENRWEVTTNHGIFKDWSVDAGWNAERLFAFRCRKNSIAIPQIAFSAAHPIKTFNDSLRKFQLQPERDENNVASLRAAIYKLSQELTDENIQTLAENLDNPTVRILLHSLFGNFYPIQKLHNYFDSYREFANPALARYFEPAINEYLYTVDRTLEHVPLDSFDFLDVGGGFIATFNYCKSRSQKSKMCERVLLKWKNNGWKVD